MTMKLSEIMSPGVVEVGADIAVQEAAEELWSQRVSAAVVIDDLGLRVGTVTTSDFLKVCSDWFVRVDPVNLDALPRKHLPMELPPQLLVRDIMTSDVVGLPAAATIMDGIHLMADLGLHRVFVEDQGRLVGVVSTFDIIRALSAMDRDAVRPRPHKRATAPAEARR